MAKTVKYLEGLTIHKVPYKIANTQDFKTNVMGKAADNELFIVTDTPTFSLKIGNVTYDGTSNVSAVVATESTNGLMSAEDKKKLDGIATGANKTDVDSSLSSGSIRPVQNKVITAALANKASTAEVTTKAKGLMSASDKTKLDGIAAGANKIIVDTVLSNSSTNPVQNKVIQSALDGKAGTTVATQSVNGLLSSADKTKLDGIATGATKITVDTALSNTSTNPVQNKVINSALSEKAGTSVATTSANGLMSAADKTKLNSIATGATKIIVDTALSTTSTNPVQNKVVKTELDKKADKTALDNKFDKTGGTLTGNLSGQYLAGTWLQTTQATDLNRTPGKIAVLDDSGWVYYRTPAEIKSDIGANGYLPTAGGTMTGAITTKGIKLTSGTDFGSSLPSSLQSNQLFFQTLGSNYILDNVYPVGSIYMSVNSTNPKNLFGGTWEQIQGKFLFGMNSSYPAGSTGGEITHRLTAAEMPTHAHYMASGNAGGDSTWTPNAGSYLVDSVTSDKTTWWAQIGMNNAGGSEAHNNMPPYLSVYIWKRTK